MCNKMVDMNDPVRKPVNIPEKGEGWKLFYVRNSEYAPLCPHRHETYRYEQNKDGWIRWRNVKYYNGDNGDGFCFFLKKKDADVAQIYWPGAVVKKIQYEQGLQERDEDNFIGAFICRVALCQAFKIVEESDAGNS